MILKMSQVLELSSIYPKLKDLPLPIATTYKLSKLFSTIETESAFGKDKLRDLILKYGAHDNSGQLIREGDDGNFQIAPEHVQDFQRLMQELLNLDISLPDITFTLNELSDVTLPMESFTPLLPFITE